MSTAAPAAISAIAEDKGKVGGVFLMKRSRTHPAERTA